MSRVEVITCDLCGMEMGLQGREGWVDASVYGADFCRACITPALPVLRALGLDEIRLVSSYGDGNTEKLIYSQWVKGLLAAAAREKKA